MKLLILGAGGIGGYFGGRLAQAGVDATFLVRPKRRETIARDGLVIESPLGNARIAARTVVAQELKPGYDLVLFTCKAYDLDSALDAIAPAMAGDCAVLPLLNGLAHLDRLDARFGAAKVMGGTCQINVSLAPDGTVKHMEPLNRILFGERDRSKSARAQAFADALAKTAIDWTWSEDILQDLWEKITFLSALAATTCLFRGNVAEIMTAPDGRAIVMRALEANVAIARAQGHPPRAQSVEFAVKRLTTPGPQSASMLRDMEAGKPVEADHIVGFMLDLARRHGLDDAVLAMAYTHLKTYEARRAARPAT
ncbi:MAG: 2-dehydropantoate 2-reductase [Betaproteobacteria bacterium]|nr:2-dehydropantoate 2-reductase [Betaproteobacteria bacterium]